jgi:hypothetical protein
VFLRRPSRRKLARRRIPPAEEIALYGTLIDSWTVPITDVGSEGVDKGKGEKYLLLPPDFKDEIPTGYIPVQLKTNNAYSLLRLITNTSSEEDQQKAVTYLRNMKIYPLAARVTPPETRFIDVYGKLFNGNDWVPLVRGMWPGVWQFPP